MFEIHFIYNAYAFVSHCFPKLTKFFFSWNLYFQRICLGNAIFKTKEHLPNIGFQILDHLEVAGGLQVQSPFNHTQT